MLPREYILVSRLDQEVGEIGQNGEAVDIAINKDARILLRNLVVSSIGYTRLVSPTTLGARSPEGNNPDELETWRREIEAADRARRSAHNVVFHSYNGLTRYCRQYRKKDLSSERQFPPGSERALIGDLAAWIRRGTDQARDLDEELFKRLTQSPD